MPKPLNEQTVLITGAAQGLGHALGRAFHSAGATVILLDVNEKGLNAVAESLESRVHTFTVDLADAKATSEAIQTIAGQHGTIDTLIHNAAILEAEPFETMTLEQWQRTVNVGIQAAFLLTQGVWKGMQNVGGCVVFVSSRSGVEGFKNESAYCTAKHGLEGLMKCLALEGEAHGIFAHTVTPGMYMHTPMSERNYTDDLKTKWVDPMLLTPAFLHLAKRTDTTLSGQRLSAWKLSQALKE
jgi:3-hydroxybutyrate dehydrogenase